MTSGAQRGVAATYAVLALLLVGGLAVLTTAVARQPTDKAIVWLSLGVGFGAQLAFALLQSSVKALRPPSLTERKERLDAQAAVLAALEKANEATVRQRGIEEAIEQLDSFVRHEVRSRSLAARIEVWNSEATRLQDEKAAIEHEAALIDDDLSGLSPAALAFLQEIAEPPPTALETAIQIFSDVAPWPLRGVLVPIAFLEDSRRRQRLRMALDEAASSTSPAAPRPTEAQAPKPDSEHAGRDDEQ